jgi:death-on-curing protein
MTTPVDLDALIDALGDIGFVVRDAGLLASALNRPLTTVFGDEAYPTIEQKAAALVQSLAKHHPMVDGNKRSAWITLNVFLEINGHQLVSRQDEAFEFVLGIANDTLDLEAIAQWISQRIQPAD